MKNDQVSLDNVPLSCPKCGRVTDSVKCYSVPNYILFIGFYVAYEFKKEICCPDCMRKQILLKYFTYNIIIGNIVWLFLGLPMGIWKLCSTFTKGHSSTVKKFLAENMPSTPTHAQSGQPQIDQNGNPIYNLNYDISKI